MAHGGPGARAGGLLRGLPGVRSTERAGEFVRVRLADDAACAAFLKAAVSAAAISEFRADEPDLEAIFLAAPDVSWQHRLWGFTKLNFGVAYGDNDQSAAHDFPQHHQHSSDQ